MSPDEAFGEVLRAVRRQQGISQENLAFATGYHRTYISLLERGRKSPSLGTIYRVAIALRITPSDLLAQVEARVDEMPQRTLRPRDEQQ